MSAISNGSVTRKERSPCLENLFQIHLAHAKSISFENLDVLLGKTISLEIQDIEKKAPQGTCGEDTALSKILFAHVLKPAWFFVHQAGSPSAL
ncbi:arylamine N-acetyltransferase [Candidatus Methylacidiphilum infernorum]|uniref:Arylamine N-acetyltransferase n=1 Tax=Candidatus Methylacidiphilum infernorum TaxID=511746 RepID=A0ABX7PTH6_9BACT|nr:arylamine N-acetyltransferase [Candidatus Methylacidiphilum infernorum]